jgi:hypothetical protein
MIGGPDNTSPARHQRPERRGAPLRCLIANGEHAIKSLMSRQSRPVRAVDEIGRNRRSNRIADDTGGKSKMRGGA